jgi:hypothetical protein
MNKAFYKGLLLDCPQCREINSSCWDDELPGYLTAVANKQKWLAPYVYYGQYADSRLWWLGLDRTGATAMCRDLAQLYRTKGIRAVCVE